MTKQEFIQRMVIGLYNAFPSANDEYIIDRAFKTADTLWQRMGIEEKVSETEEKVVTEVISAEHKLDIYQALCEEIEPMRGVHWNHRNEVAGALLNEDSFLSLQAAKSLSSFYGRININKIKRALEIGEIEGKIPQKKAVQTSNWRCNERYKLTRQQPVGKYELKVKSLVLWLEERYARVVNNDSLIYKYLNEIAKKK